MPQTNHFDFLSAGKTKELHRVPKHPEQIILLFTDYITAFNEPKYTKKLPKKGQVCCELSTLCFNFLSTTKEIPTHFIQQLDANRMLCWNTKPIRLEVVVRNVATGSYLTRYNVSANTILNPPVVEFFLKDDRQHDPFISTTDILQQALLTNLELAKVINLALLVNEKLQQLFAKIDKSLVDLKLEFGFNSDHQILLIDELTPDSWRLYDQITGEKFDKDAYRLEQTNIVPVYKNLLIQLQNILPVNS